MQSNWTDLLSCHSLSVMNRMLCTHNMPCVLVQLIVSCPWSCQRQGYHTLWILHILNLPELEKELFLSSSTFSLLNIRFEVFLFGWVCVFVFPEYYTKHFLSFVSQEHCKMRNSPVFKSCNTIKGMEMYFALLRSGTLSRVYHAFALQ